MNNAGEGGQLPRRRSAWLWACLAAAQGFAGVAAAGLGFLPLSLVERIGAALLPDGSLDLLDLPGFAWSRPIVGLGGLFLLACSVGLLAGWARARARLAGWLPRLAKDAASLWKDALRALPRGWPLAFLLGVMAAGAYARLLHLFWPMQYDEAYTYLAFARRSFFSALTDYHLPNNHIFHTLLVYASTQEFGSAPWAIRLPAFLAGWLTIPAAFLLARRHANLTAAFLASGLAAIWPFLVYYSANARGYSLIGLLVLLLLLLGTYLLGRPNAAGWIGFALLSALGIFTVPVMLYGFGVVCLWLFLSQLAGQARAYPGWQFIFALAASGLLAAALAGLLYLPAALISGPEALFGNSFVRSLSLFDLWRTLPDGLNTLFGDWTTEMPRWLAVCAGVLTLLGWILHRRNRGPLRVPVQAALILWVLVVVPIQRPEPLPKLWYWLFPLAVVWAAAGLAGLLSFIAIPRRLQIAGAVVLLAATVGLAVLQSGENWLYLKGAQGSEERVADFLAAQSPAAGRRAGRFPD